MLFCKPFSLPSNLTDPILKFFAKNPFKKILVACSGGPDSKALLVVLAGLAKRLDLKLGVVHIDHRWRAESELEALSLKAFCEELGTPFHLKVLDSSLAQTELAAREARLKIFKEIATQHEYEAVVLGHQKEDQAETVLKRIFEGASLASLSGIQEATLSSTLSYLRPWLNVSKEEILAFCVENKIEYVIDSTNLNGRYLRGRMRSDLFPLLEHSFGKTICSSLVKIGEEALEFKQFMQSRYSEYLHEPYCLDLSSIATPFEMRWLISEWLKKYLLIPSSKVINQIIELVKANKADRSVELQGAKIQVDRKRLFLLFTMRSLPEPQKLELGEFTFGDWKVTVKKCEEYREKRGWQNGWKGELLATLPLGDYWIGSAQDFKCRKEQLRFFKQCTNQKTPSFFKKFIPLIFSKEQMCYDFLDCSSIPKVQKNPWIQVLLQNTLSWNHSIDKIK